MTQLQIFIVCTAFGILFGVVYELFYVLRRPFQKKYMLCVVTDIVFCVLCGVVFLFFITENGLGGLRIYMVAAGIVGFVLYQKSFHKIVAFFVERGYNVFIKRKHMRKKDKRLWRNSVSLCRKKKQEES